MFAVPFAFLFLIVAGPALAFNITLGTQVLQGNQVLAFDFTVFPLTGCNGNCTIAQQTINACTDDSCFCGAAAVSSLLSCQQCMYESLIAANKPMPDPRAGSTPLLAAYATSCNASGLPLNPAPALAVPPFWDGNFGQFVPTGPLVITVGTAFFLGASSILILSNM